MKRVVLAGVAAILLASCSSDSEGTIVNITPGPTTSSTVPVTALSIDELFDPNTEFPDTIERIDLGDQAPPNDGTFCTAFATAPTRWVNDAIVPIQAWLDAWSDLDDVPTAANASLGRLRNHANKLFRWNFDQSAARPELDGDLIVDATIVAEEAVASCDDLPLVANYLRLTELPNRTDAEIAEFCAAEAARVEDGIARYVELLDRQPVHQQQLDTALYTSVDGEGYLASDVYGIGPDAAPAPTPDGPCATN